MTDLQLKLVQRYASWDDVDAGREGIEWAMNSNLTQVKTATAFALARGGISVTCVDEDADYELEVDEQDEHYPDKTKTYPEIETIFVVEGEL